MKWKYGDSWERYPIEPGQVWGLPNGSMVAVHNIYEPLPSWMRADLVFVDPPWNLGNLNSFYTKAGRTDHRRDFGEFSDTLMQRILDIGACTAYVEMGNQFVDDWVERLEDHFPHVQRWAVTYYRKHPTNLLRASTIAPIDYDFTGLDEAHCIKLVAQLEDYDTIADPCMGRGLVGLAAYQNGGRRFVGIELNKRRLAVLLDRLAKAGATVVRLDQEDVEVRAEPALEVGK